MLNKTSWVKNLKTPIAVIGLGKSGLSALKFLKSLGYADVDLITYDDKNPSAQMNDSARLLARSPQTLVVSPGVSLKTDWIQSLVSTGSCLTSEISLASSVLTTEKVIGITGSVGKSTVTSLLGAGAVIADSHCFVGGNLGVPFCDYANDMLVGRTKADWVILELSSYQLENCEHLKLEFSAVTYLSPNHLERYESLDQYYRTKLKITDITKSICFFSQTSKDAIDYSRFSKAKSKLVNTKNFADQKLLSQVVLIGSHNKDNFSVAAEIALAAGWKASAITAMTQYRGLSHRLEFAGQVMGVQYINDSKATAMDSVIVASQGCLESLSANNRLYLLLGGKDKNLPWEQLAVFSADPRIKSIFFGACGELAKQKSNLSGNYFEKLGAALEFARKNAVVGDVVLLSPGGTSLDEFKNFEERGDFFKNFVIQKNAQHSAD